MNKPTEQTQAKLPTQEETVSYVKRFKKAFLDGARKVGDTVSSGFNALVSGVRKAASKEPSASSAASPDVRPKEDA